VLHTNEPRWLGKRWNRKGLDELWRKISGLFFFGRGFKFRVFALIIHFTQTRQRGFGLKFEECIV